MANFKSIGDWVNSVEKKADLLSRKLVLDIDRQLLDQSPVDTGRFKGNWQLGINSVPVGEVDTTDNSGSATFAKHQAQMPTKASGKAYYLVNNLPYAWPLEYGHSKQAPRGWVARTVLNFQHTAEQIAAELK